MKGKRKNLADELHKRVNILAVLLTILILWSLVMSPGVSVCYQGKERFAPINTVRFTVTNSRLVVRGWSTGLIKSPKSQGLRIRWAPDANRLAWHPWWAGPTGRSRIGMMEFPLVYPAAFFLACSVAFTVFKPRRHLAGHCPTCNYDLAGLESGICPECGEGAKA